MSQPFLKALLLAALVLGLCLPLAVPAFAAPPPPDKQLVGYFIEWGVYARNYLVKDVQTSGAADKLTVINYAFANAAPKYS